jgi:hypothetical protein
MEGPPPLIEARAPPGKKFATLFNMVFGSSESIEYAGEK